MPRHARSPLLPCLLLLWFGALAAKTRPLSRERVPGVVAVCAVDLLRGHDRRSVV